MRDKLLGDKLKELRENSGLLQRQVASILDIDTPMYSKFERGDRLPKKEQLSQLANIFKSEEKELRALWLADKVLKIVSNELEINQEAIKLAHDLLDD
ncbi:MAG: helix-turn-helix domain-containing protein, partial [Muribaculum sp.]|nr:helix-turn-helix domain-containing protein [Muribaculum sp.]